MQYVFFIFPFRLHGKVIQKKEDQDAAYLKILHTREISNTANRKSIEATCQNQKGNKELEEGIHRNSAKWMKTFVCLKLLKHLNAFLAAVMHLEIVT